jgi:hypothetical protein
MHLKMTLLLEPAFGIAFEAAGEPCRMPKARAPDADKAPPGSKLGKIKKLRSHN